MAEQNIWQRFVAAIHNEYERRIRAASLVTEYGASHHGHNEDEHGHDDEAEVAVIANVPRGTRVGRAQHNDESIEQGH